MTRFWRRLAGRIREFFSTANNVLSHQIRITSQRLRPSYRQPSNDWSRSDYAYWERAYYCRARGLEISGLFLKPLCNKVATWTLGRAPGFQMESEASAQALIDWWNAHHADILAAFLASLKSGDAFLVINPDLSVTLLPPDTVEPIVSEDDYGLVIGWRVSQTLAHPQRLDRMTLVDEYYPDRRVQRLERNGLLVRQTVFPNLIGRVPLVHIANQPQAGQTFGHAEGEALLEILHRYGEIFESAIEGNRRQGHPTPVIEFESEADLDAFWSLYGRERQVTLPDGTTEPQRSLQLDLNDILTVAGAKFSYQSPGQFAGDTETLLGLMFYLILEHTELPEFIFGNAISSSKASAETQMPVFETFIEARRTQIGQWLIAVAEIALGYLALIQPGVSVAAPALQWPKLSQDGKLTLETVSWAFSEGLLDERTALMLAPVEVKDIDQVLASAKLEREERQRQNEDQMDQQLRDEIEQLEI